jgi:hypothetical protein
LRDTHAPSHTQWTLDIEQIYTLERAEEAGRRLGGDGKKKTMLLWHGSRMSNFIGILSQGLRIAPPEAPATGYSKYEYVNNKLYIAFT